MSRFSMLLKNDSKTVDTAVPTEIDPIQLSHFVPIKTLSPDHVNELASKSSIVALQQGKNIFKPGDNVAHISYLLTGEVEVSNESGKVKRVVGGSNPAMLPLEQNSIHQLNAKVVSAVAVVIQVDSNLLDIMLTWQQSGGYEVQDIEDGDGDGDGGEDWMSRLLQAKVFHKIPPANIQSIFMRMEAEHFKSGESVINQGDEGDRFYLVREGECVVVRKTRKNPEGVLLANLKAGDNFGEEALISGGKRNASIVMKGDGVLMSLTKKDFLELMNEPLIHYANFADIKSEDDSMVWIDVRLPAEYQARHVRNSINLPLPILRTKLDKLNVERKYIIYCDTGRRSSTATYLLTQNGFDAYVLRNGMQNIPADDLVTTHP